MIHTTLKFINDELNSFALLRYGLATPFCSLQNISQFSGSGSSTESQLIISLIHVEEDRIAKSPEQYLRTGNGTYNINQTVPINLYCLFAGVNDNAAPSAGTYEEALKAISVVLRFFQTKNVFTPSNSSIDPRVTQLIANLYTLNFQELNDVWMSNGGKYYPSVIYKLRTLFYEDDPMGQVGIITQVDVNTQGN